MAVVFIGMCIVGLLASIFDWDWYFLYGRGGSFWDDLLGRDINRVVNGIFCVIVALVIATVGID
ncbi:MAG: hypothetical protein K2K57_13845 [Oscillospiraceae bacterium]|nr:hypothetical protein [Oscillospiraceae bacterium]